MQCTENQAQVHGNSTCKRSCEREITVSYRGPNANTQLSVYTHVKLTQWHIQCTVCM